jgi:UDP-N-acetylmuramoyl-L-alanyl-D-glutamate--2,6-diaminopimelate ligase
MADPAIRPSRLAPQRIDALVARLAAAGRSGVQLRGDEATLVGGATHDSRAVQPQDLYIARAGERTHGIEHVAAAVAAGASAVLTDPGSAGQAQAAGARTVVIVDSPREAMGPAAAWVYGDPADSLLLLGVTGTNGKTTTAYLLDAGLRAAGHRTGLLGTIETRIAGEAVPSARTTPEATELQALLALMKERGVDAVAMEVSSHALALGRVDGMVFDVAAFTNLSQDHLDFHRDMDGYFAAKAKLFTPAHSRRGVVTVDDQWGQRLAREAAVPVTTVGAGAGEWRRHDVPDSAGEARRTVLAAPDGSEHLVATGLLGGINLPNAALAYLTLLTAGLDGEAARRGIAELTSIPGRMERIDAGQPYLAVVDYAHTPAAVSRLLAEARELAAPSGRVIVVLGCGGDRDREKRPLMGAAAAAGADLAVFTNDNPRSEDPAAIIEAMLAGVPSDARVLVEPDRRHAIELAVASAAEGDALVVAGKGHEQGQETAGVVVPFDDREALREVLASHAAEVG